MRKIFIAIIRFYQLVISPTSTSLFGNACRFTPTCSQYTIEALEKYGAARGLFLGIKRFSRCHPFGKFGYDPIPEKLEGKKILSTPSSRNKLK